MAYSSAHSKRVRWILFSRPRFREAARLTTHPSLLPNQSPEGQANVTQSLEAEEVLRETKIEGWWAQYGMVTEHMRLCADVPCVIRCDGQ